MSGKVEIPLKKEGKPLQAVRLSFKALLLAGDIKGLRCTIGGTKHNDRVPGIYDRAIQKPLAREGTFKMIRNFLQRS